MYPEITVPEIMKQAIKDAIDDDEVSFTFITIPLIVLF